jgi:hypothetical protein
MNEQHKKLAAAMLSEYANALGNKCCNDWNFPEDWTTQEKEEFCKGYHEWNGDPEEFTPEHLYLPDFAVADYLAYLLAGNEPN